MPSLSSSTNSLDFGICGVEEGGERKMKFHKKNLQKRWIEILGQFNQSLQS